MTAVGGVVVAWIGTCQALGTQPARFFPPDGHEEQNCINGLCRKRLTFKYSAMFELAGIRLWWCGRRAMAYGMALWHAIYDGQEKRAFCGSSIVRSVDGQCPNKVLHAVPR